MPENNENQSGDVHDEMNQASPQEVKPEAITPPISVPVVPSLSPEQSGALGPKPKRIFSKMMLGINGFVLIPTAIMVFPEPFLGSAAIGPALIVAPILPFVGVLLVVDLVLLTVFLIRSVFRKEYARKAFLGALVAWLAIVGLAGLQVHDYIQQNKPIQLISRDKAVQLVRDCKVREMWKQNGGDASTSSVQGESAALPQDLPTGVTEDIQLNYKDSGQGPQTDIANWDALVSAAQQSAGRCGPVTQGNAQADYILQH